MMKNFHLIMKEKLKNQEIKKKNRVFIPIN